MGNQGGSGLIRQLGEQPRQRRVLHLPSFFRILFICLIPVILARALLQARAILLQEKVEALRSVQEALDDLQGMRIIQVAALELQTKETSDLLHAIEG